MKKQFLNNLLQINLKLINNKINCNKLLKLNQNKLKIHMMKMK